MILEIQNYLDSTYTISLTESKVFFHSNNGFSDGDSLSKLKVNIKGYEQIEMEYYFGDTNGFCDSIRIQYSCNHCMDKHISELLSDRKRKWKKTDNNRYLSKKWVSTFKSSENNITYIGYPQMIIDRNQTGPYCASVSFSIPMMTKDQWKEKFKNKTHALSK